MWKIIIVLIILLLVGGVGALIAAVIATDTPGEFGEEERKREDEEQIRCLREQMKMKEEKRNARALHKKLQSGAIPPEIPGGEGMQKHERSIESGTEGNPERELFSDKG